MATINSTFALVTSKPRQSTWLKVKSWCFEFIQARPAMQTLCCLDGSELECYQTDKAVRSALRENLRAHMGYSGRESCVANAVTEVFVATGYDLADGGGIRSANKGVKRTMREWDAYFADLGLDPAVCFEATTREANERPARIVPKFAAACALHIRSKLGCLTSNDANVLLVQRKYLELCRRHGVRDVDTVLHQQFVMNAVFTESVLDDVATVRRRLPQWVTWLDSLAKPNTMSPTVC